MMDRKADSGERDMADPRKRSPGLRPGFSPLLGIVLGLVVLSLIGMGIVLVFEPESTISGRNSNRGPRASSFPALPIPGGPERAFSAASKQGTALEGTYIVFFKTTLNRAEQKRILASFPKVTYLRDGFFKPMAEVSIAGNVAATTSQMHDHDGIAVVLNLEGFAICH